MVLIDLIETRPLRTGRLRPKPIRLLDLAAERIHVHFQLSVGIVLRRVVRTVLVIGLLIAWGRRCQSVCRVLPVAVILDRQPAAIRDHRPVALARAARQDFSGSIVEVNGPGVRFQP